jgi:hypothetical protein
MPFVAAILSVVESCRRLKLPVRDYLAAVLPGFGDLPIRVLRTSLPLRGSLTGAYRRVGNPAFSRKHDPIRIADPVQNREKSKSETIAPVLFVQPSCAS